MSGSVAVPANAPSPGTAHVGVALDPARDIGLGELGRRLRDGRLSAESVTAAYLDRIAALDPRLGCFEHVAGDALAHAAAIGRLLRAGTDLGPLMGVPVAVKDMFAIEWLPTKAGAALPVEDLIGPEGTFIKRLKRAGCVILGTTKMAEFALGGRSGVNSLRGTPWNPCDAQVHRIPGSSSSGSAAAMAAGLCALAIGSDTGGSIRLPSALCGVFGLKTTAGLWATDGMFPSIPMLDTIGIMTASAADAAVAFKALTNAQPARPRDLRGVRLGKPSPTFFDNLDPDVERCVTLALAELERRGAMIVPLDIPEAGGIGDRFRQLLQAEIVASLGRERLINGRKLVSEWTWNRIAGGFEVSADTAEALRRDLAAVQRTVQRRLREVDALIGPTTGLVALPVEDSHLLDDGIQHAPGIGPSTQRRLAANLFGLCGASLPIQHLGASPLPVGLQLLCGPQMEAELLSIALAVEQALGPPRLPDLNGFVTTR